MKIQVIKDSNIAGSDWKKGTLLEAPEQDAKKAIADGDAELPKAPKPKAKPASGKN